MVVFLFTNVWAQHSFFILFFQVYHLGSNFGNRRTDLDKAIKKVSPVEQRLIDQLRRVCILVKGFTRDTWMRLKLIRETWILMKGERDSWIYELKWDMICLLIYTWPINFFFHFVKTSRFPGNIRTETWRFPFSKREAGIFPKHSCAKHDQGLHFAAGQIWRT